MVWDRGDLVGCGEIVEQVMRREVNAGERMFDGVVGGCRWLTSQTSWCLAK